MSGQEISVGLNPETGKYLAVDDFTDAQVVLQGDHYYIHKGQAFQLPSYITVPGSGVYEYIITVPNATTTGKYVHWRPTRLAASASGVKVELYEAPTYTGGTLATGIINMNRNNTTITPLTTVTTGNPTVTANGTLLSVDIVGSGGTPTKVAGGTGGNENEIVLKSNTKYLLLLTNLSSTDAIVSSDIFWYEEDAG